MGGMSDAGAEGLWALPEGWCWANLGGLGTWIGGGTPSKANEGFRSVAKALGEAALV